MKPRRGARQGLRNANALGLDNRDVAFLVASCKRRVRKDAVMHNDFPRYEAPTYSHARAPEWHSATWLSRQADAQLAMGRHVAAERLEARAAELREARA